MIMSERTIRVQPSELNAQASAIKSKIVDYNNAYGDIVSQANFLTTTSWGGQDAEAFKEKVNEFKRNFEEMATILEQYVNFLKKSAGVYQTAQSEVINSIGTLETKIR